MKAIRHRRQFCYQNDTNSSIAIFHLDFQWSFQIVVANIPVLVSININHTTQTVHLVILLQNNITHASGTRPAVTSISSRNWALRRRWCTQLQVPDHQPRISPSQRRDVGVLYSRRSPESTASPISFSNHFRRNSSGRRQSSCWLPGSHLVSMTTWRWSPQWSRS